MKDRLVTLLGALLALAIVYALFFQRPGEPPATKPLSVEAGRNGYLGLWNWLAQQGVAVRSLRDRYTQLLEDSSFGDSGNVLVITMPFRTPLRIAEVTPLQSWIREGNTVLILAALDDTPDWMPIAGDQLMLDLAALTGMRFRASRGGSLDDTPGAGAAADETGDAGDARQDASADAGDDTRETAAGGGEGSSADTADDVSPFDFAKAPIAAQSAIELQPVAEHPLLAGVDSLRGFSDGPSEVWRGLHPDEYRPALRLAFETSSGLDAMWELPRGRGQIIVAASSSLLANRNIGEGDARRFVANLIRHHLGTGGAVIFDDMHQGLSALYDASAFLRDERLRYTIWFVLAAWLVYIVGSSNRLSSPRPQQTVPRQGEFLAAAGGLMARRLEQRAAGLLLIDEWLDDVRRARGLPRDAALWSELTKTPTLARGIYEELHGYHRQLARGGSVDLVRLHNVLKQAREAIG
jgi:hypothetical protein